MNLFWTLLAATGFFGLCAWIGIRCLDPEWARRRFDRWHHSAFSIFVIPPGVETPEQFAKYTRIIIYINLTAVAVAYAMTVFGNIRQALSH